jgi:O-acetyl-ADP-ribose deacetylase (regulator of RNase III)
MGITYVVADAISSPTRTLAHGCNAQGRMGKGFAKLVRDRYPGSFDAYVKKHHESGLAPGDVVPWKGPDRNILNCITQRYYGNDGRLYADYDAIRTCMRTIEKAARAHVARRDGIFHDEPVLGMPRIGTGLAGGDWNVIERILRDEISSIDVVVYDWPPRK